MRVTLPVTRIESEWQRCGGGRLILYNMYNLHSPPHLSLPSFNLMLFLETQRVLWVGSWHPLKTGGMIGLPLSGYFYRCLHFPIIRLVISPFFKLSLWAGDPTYLQYITWRLTGPWISSLYFILTTMYPVYCSYLLLSACTRFLRWMTVQYGFFYLLNFHPVVHWSVHELFFM